ncbi:MAG: family 43 glycosylhydrolase [Bacteroidaceae bacterium]|nr:family 43 glycosylhydrolase [Bacteroidaceae bacterium]
MAVTTTANAQLRREYTPSPVSGSAWNVPSNINPIIPGYFADPTIRKFGDTYYIYATTDGTGNGYGPAQVWMSTDFVNWRNFVMNWPTTEVVWAPDVVQQPNGKYRYYYCEPCNVNIGESDSPIGPWHNILGKEDAVMVPDRYIHNVITLDPMLFKDDDGSQYLYFTTWGIYKGFGCGVAKLRDGDYDLSALSTKYRDARRWNENSPFPIAADEFFTEKKLILNDELKDIFEAPFIFKRNGIYYFTYSSGSCHTDTYRVQYATSTTGPMGPWQYKGQLLTTNEDGTVHGPGHHSILEQDGQYYIVYHRHNIAKSVHGFNRQLCIDKIEFDAEGNILPIVPTHDGVNPLSASMQKKAARYVNLAFGAKVTASSYYDDMHKPEYAADDNNATLWKARKGVWDTKLSAGAPQWLMLDLGKVKSFREIWTQFEYPTFFYQYKIETSIDANSWTLYADRTANTMQGSPMIDQGRCKARYIRITITDTQKNGHLPAIWNVKVWDKAPQLPAIDAESNDAYPGMHLLDVAKDKRNAVTDASINIDMMNLAAGKAAPFDITDIESTAADASSGIRFKANKPIHVRVKDGKWAMFFNGTQSLRSEVALPDNYRYNAPYTIMGYVLSTKPSAVATVASLSTSRADLATTEFRLGTDPSAGLINHNGSFESCGAPKAISESAGKWHLWTVTYDGWMERVYMDGKLIHSQNNFIMVRPDGHITIGADGSESNNFMGYISSLRIMPYSTSEADILKASQQYEAMHVASLGDDDFEEIDPDSKFTLNPDFRLQYESKEAITLSTSSPAFNDAPLENGGQILKQISGDFVMMCTIDDMEGLKSHSVKGYNEGGLLIATEGNTYYQYGAFPLYNCGNMLTVLSSRGRPQYQNYKGYDYDRYIQFERRGNKLFARSSADGVTWNNNPGSPVELRTDGPLRLGIYQTTYSDAKSWVKLNNIRIYSK